MHTLGAWIHGHHGTSCSAHLGAELLTSAAFSDNAASHNVSGKLGYRPDGTDRVAIRGELGFHVRLALTRERFVRPEWPVEVAGLDGCRRLLGSDAADR